MDIFLVMQLSSYGQRNGMQKSIWPSFSVFRLQCYIVSTYFNIRLNCRCFSKLGHVLQLLICLAQSRLVEFMHVYQTPEVYSALQYWCTFQFWNACSERSIIIIILTKTQGSQHCMLRPINYTPWSLCNISNVPALSRKYCIEPVCEVSHTLG